MAARKRSKKSRPEPTSGAPLKMRRIPPPDWARPPKVDLDDAGAEEAYSALRPLWDQILAVVQQEVERYVNADDVTCATDDEGGFPARSCLTGEYYLSDEHYALQDTDGRAYYRVSLMAHCLEKKWLEHQKEFDYLGLEVWLMVWQDTLEIQVDGVNSFVI